MFTAPSLLRSRSAACLVISATASLALPALAGTPKALSMVPSNAEAVIVMPNLGQLLIDMDQMNAMLGDMGKSEVTMMTSMIRGMPGINLSGSAAVVLDLADDFQAGPDAIVLLPVSSFNDLTQGRTAVDGLVEFPMGADPIYFRDIGGGYAAMSNDTAVLSAFTPASHSVEQVQTMLGTAGNRVAGANDIMVMMNLSAIRPMLEESFKALEEQGDMIEMMGGAEAAKGFDSFMNAYKTAVKDGHSVVSGMSFDAESGFTFDIGLQFTEGTSTASFFNNEGNAGSYFDHVPQMDFFYAQAFDLSGQGIQTMFDSYFEMIKAADTSGMLTGLNINDLMKEFKGGAQVIGATELMGMNGMLSKTIMYTESKENTNALKSLQDMYAKAGHIEQNGVTVDSSFSAEPKTINGIKAYSHSMSIKMDQMGGGGGFGAANPAMALQMIYGPTGGPSGYAAQAGDGLVFTFSQDEALLTKAYNAANGKDTMMSNKGIAAAAKMLPDNRVMEAYVGVDHLLNSVGPMLMMFGILPDFEPMNALTPVAFGATADGGGMLVRTVVPMNTVKAVMDLVPEGAFNGIGGGQDDWDDDQDDDDMSF